MRARAWMWAAGASALASILIDFRWFLASALTDAVLVGFAAWAVHHALTKGEEE